MQPTRSYLICTTPRSGSSLLCDILRGSELAGKPVEYFYDGAYPTYFERFKVSTFAGYLEKVLDTTPTPNGVFGAKFMTYYFYDFVERVRELPAYQTKNITTSELLAAVFPNVKYIWLTRRDKVRQAVSYAKAIQTDVWHSYDHKPQLNGSEPSYDVAMTDNLIRALVLQDAAWQAYFSQTKIKPLTLVYEDFSQTPEETARLIFDYLGISVPAGWTLGNVRMGKKLAGSKSELFVQSYREQFKSSWVAWKEPLLEDDNRVQRAIKKLGLKIAAKPGFGWLYQFRGLAKKLLSGAK